MLINMLTSYEQWMFLVFIFVLANFPASGITNIFYIIYSCIFTHKMSEMKKFDTLVFTNPLCSVSLRTINLVGERYSANWFLNSWCRR